MVQFSHVKSNSSHEGCIVNNVACKLSPSMQLSRERLACEWPVKSLHYSIKSKMEEHNKGRFLVAMIRLKDAKGKTPMFQVG